MTVPSTLYSMSRAAGIPLSDEQFDALRRNRPTRPVAARRRPSAGTSPSTTPGITAGLITPGPQHGHGVGEGATSTGEEGGTPESMTPTEPGASGVGARPPESAPTTGRTRRGPRQLDIELAVACVLLAGVAVASVYFMARPEPTVFDRWVFAVIPKRPRSGYVIAVTRLGSPLVVGAGAVAAFLATIRRDRARAVALLVAPAATVFGCDVILKPVVGRTFDGVLSFPSGSVAVVAALATAAVLATPDRLRWGTGVVGGTGTALMVLAVIALGWHYPTDTFGGLGVGIGTVLLFDCVARRIAARLGWGRPEPPPAPRPSEAEQLARR